MSPNASTTLGRVLAAPRRLVGAAGSNFYYSFLLLPKAKRRAITEVYRFARLLDDIVDEDPQGRDPYAELQTWRDEIEFIYRGTPTTAFGDRLMESVEEFDLPKQPFLDLVDGMEMDLKWHSYQSFTDLREYCYRAASTVGLICIEIFGYENARTREYAVNLGLALQLTNILRDLKEDIQRDRIYLPLEDLERFGYTADDLRAHRYNQPFIELMKHEYQRARSYFMKAAASLPETDRPSMFAAEIMATIYREILEQMPGVQFNVFRNRLTVSKKRRMKIALEIWLRSKFKKS